MAMTREQMDRKMDAHFDFEARDDIEGVLSTLAMDAEHDVVGWPTGPVHGRESARNFYETLFADLSDGGVECIRRYYGDGFLVDESLWRGWTGGTAHWPSACCMSSSSPGPATLPARMSGWTSQRSWPNCPRIHDKDPNDPA